MKRQIEQKAKLVLGIDENAKKSELKRAYHKKIIQYHPDKNKNPQTKRISSLIIEAYNFLRGKINKANLLNENSLVSITAGISISDLESPRENYKKQNINQFYDFINPKTMKQ